MQPENTIIEEKHVLNRVTPVSKYFAMVLFIVLPFIGGFIGYSLVAPNQELVSVPAPLVLTHSSSSDSGSPNMLLLSERTIIGDSQISPGLNISHTETVAVQPLPGSLEHMKFDIGSVQSLYLNDKNTTQDSEAAVFASRLDYNQHLRFNERTSEWYLEEVNGTGSTTLFRVHKLLPEEDVKARVSAIHEADAVLGELEREVLLQLAQQFPDTAEEYFLNRDFCQIEERFDGVTGYISVVKPEYREAVDALAQHPGIFCSKPTIIKINDVLVENYGLAIDATQPKAFNFQPVSQEELSAY